MGLGLPHRSGLACAACVVFLTACAGSDPAEERQAASASSSPIVGGSVAMTCQWPTTVLVLPIECSGTLVHPRVVITAKHCLVDDRNKPDPPKSIGLGETNGKLAKTVKVSKCAYHPRNDFGYCILGEDVSDVPIVPVMAPCEMSELKAGKAVVEAGFGTTSASSSARYGTKKWINATIVNAGAELSSIDVTSGSQDGEYYGDSGGPLFFKMPDGTWRLIGEDCCSDDIKAGSKAPRTSTYTSVPYHAAWAEQQSGIDLTPCHDDEGWNAGVECKGFPTNPDQGIGTWSDSCQGAALQRYPTCGGVLLDAGTLDAGDDAGRDSGAGASDGGGGGPGGRDSGGGGEDAGGEPGLDSGPDLADSGVKPSQDGDDAGREGPDAERRPDGRGDVPAGRDAGRSDTDSRDSGSGQGEEGGAGGSVTGFVGLSGCSTTAGVAPELGAICAVLGFAVPSRRRRRGAAAEVVPTPGARVRPPRRNLRSLRREILCSLAKTPGSRPQAPGKA